MASLVPYKNKDMRIEFEDGKLAAFVNGAPVLTIGPVQHGTPLVRVLLWQGRSACPVGWNEKSCFVIFSTGMAILLLFDHETIQPKFEQKY